MHADTSHSLVVDTSDWRVDCTAIEVRIEGARDECDGLELEYQGLIAVRRRDGNTSLGIQDKQSWQGSPLIYIADLLRYEIAAVSPHFTGDITGIIIDPLSGRVLWFESMVYDLFGMIPLCFDTSRVTQIDRERRSILVKF